MTSVICKSHRPIDKNMTPLRREMKGRRQCRAITASVREQVGDDPDRIDKAKSAFWSDPRCVQAELRGQWNPGQFNGSVFLARPFLPQRIEQGLCAS